MNVVLAILHHAVYGGPHNQLLRLSRPLSEHGWTTVVILPEERGDGAARLRTGGLKVIQLPLHRPRRTLNPGPHLELLFEFLPEISMLRRVIREEHASIVQVFGPMYPHGAIAARLEHVPVVWQLLGTFAPPLIRALLMPMVLRLSTVIMATGVEVAHAHPGATLMGHRLVTFSPPVDTNEFRPDPVRRAQARRKLEIPEDGLLVGTVGNFNQSKGHDIFVKAAEKIRTQVPNAFFRILGARTPSQETYYEKNVMELARGLRMFEKGRLRFMEPGNRVAELLPAFDLFVLTSRAEGVPTAVLEAMACGVPVVATQVGSVHEVIVEGTTGHLVNLSTLDALAGKIQELLLHPSELHRMGRAARAIAIRRYDTSLCRDNHLLAYEMALRGGQVNKSPSLDKDHQPKQAEAGDKVPFAKKRHPLLHERDGRGTPPGIERKPDETAEQSS